MAGALGRCAANRGAAGRSWFPRERNEPAPPFGPPWSLPQLRICALLPHRRHSYVALCSQAIENTASSMQYQKCKATPAYRLTRGVAPVTFAKKVLARPVGRVFEGVVECALE